METTILGVLVAVLVAAVAGYWWFFMRTKNAGGTDMMAGGSDTTTPGNANLTMDTEGMDMGGEDLGMAEDVALEDGVEEEVPAPLPGEAEEDVDMGMDEPSGDEGAVAEAGELPLEEEEGTDETQAA